MPADQAVLFGAEGLLIHPMGDRVLVKPKETPDEVCIGNAGLIVPEQAKAHYPAEGVIMECGPDCPTVPVPERDAQGNIVMGEGDQPVMTEQPVLSPGTRVVFTKYTGLQLTVGDTRFLLVPFADICGYLDAEAPALEKEPAPSWMPKR